VKQVNAVTAGLHVELGNVAAVNARFGSHQNLGVLAPQLAQSERTLALLGARLAALHPPPEAKPVAATLARYVAVARTLAAELHQFALFIPPFSAAVKQADGVAAAFRRAARTAKTAPVQAAAVAAYGGGLSRPLAALGRLSPPQVLRPSYVSEVHVLQTSRTTALALAAALRLHQAAKTHALVQQLGRETAGNGSIATQRAQIAAVRAYDAKVAEIRRLQLLAQRQIAALTH
jgi:hypothetical protein